MTCQHCGAALPPIAMFCGECGRSVSARAVVPPVVERPTAPFGAAVAEHPPTPSVDSPPASLPGSPAEPPVELPTDPPAVEGGAPIAAPGRACDACGTLADDDDLYCGECGRPLASDTVIIEPLPVVGPPSSPQPTLSAVAVDPLLAPTEPSIDTESTRIVPRGTGGARFVLQFSTGESYTVLGSGLAGRNPRPEPGEFVDHLATIVDPGRSVSKTHLEFGQHDGVFWVNDRHSGNGSVIREPGAESRVCEPGRRYPVVRGTRIDLGEQFVVVS